MTIRPSISVIVVIYQAESYLCRCVDSILSQSFVDFELLLIDDGSIDRSGEICDDYAKIDSRVKVIHKSNEGRSLSRRCGMEIAQGEYTIHCDPDDWIECDMLEKLFDKARITGADIVMCDVLLEFETYRKLSEQNYTGDFLNVIYDPLSASLCNKLIKKEIYTKFGITFEKEVIYAEDLFVMLQIFQHVVKVEHVKHAMYHYDKFSNKNSIMRTVSSQDIVRSIEFMEKYFDGEADIALTKLKMDALVIAYRNDKEVYNLKYREYFHECDSLLLISGLKHPLSQWNRLVIALQRYHLAVIGDFYSSLISFLKKYVFSK